MCVYLYAAVYLRAQVVWVHDGPRRMSYAEVSAEGKSPARGGGGDTNGSLNSIYANVSGLCPRGCDPPPGIISRFQLRRNRSTHALQALRYVRGVEFERSYVSDNGVPYQDADITAERETKSRAASEILNGNDLEIREP